MARKTHGKREQTEDGPLFSEVFKAVGEGDTVVAAVTCTQAAEALKVTSSRVTRAVRDGKLRGGQTGREWWVDLEQLEEVLREGGWHALDIRPGPRGPRKKGSKRA